MIAFGVITFAPSLAFAQTDPNTQACEQLKLVDPTVNCGAGEADTFINSIAGSVIKILFRVLGAVSVIVIIIGGFRFVVSGGNPDNAKKARESILYAIYGIVIAVAAEAIVRFVLNA